jgi:hypothetical protein
MSVISGSMIDRHVRCKGWKYDDGSGKENSPEKAGLQEIVLKRRVRSKVDVLKELCGIKVSECSSKSKSVITEDGAWYTSDEQANCRGQAGRIGKEPFGNETRPQTRPTVVKNASAIDSGSVHALIAMERTDPAH